MAYFNTNVLDNQIKALPTVSTASGSVATFDTDLTENLIECVCDIDNSASEIIVGYDYNYDYFIDFNQLVQNGNFADSSEWYGYYGTLSISNNKATLTCQDNSAFPSIRQVITIQSNHKYLFVGDFTPSKTTIISPYFEATFSLGSATVTANTKTKLSFIFDSANKSGAGNLFLFCNRSTPTTMGAGDTCDYENIMIMDLTQKFGSTKADEIYAMEQQTTGAGVAYVKNLLYKDYYEHTLSKIETIGTANNDGTGGTFNIAFGETVSSGATYEVVSGLLTRSDTTTKKVDNCIIPTNNGNNNVMCNTGDISVKYLLSVGKKIS